MRFSKQYEELDQPVTISIKTKCPDKWILFDRETGETYVANSSGHWDKMVKK